MRKRNSDRQAQIKMVVFAKSKKGSHSAASNEPVMEFRPTAALRARIADWAELQSGKPSLSEATSCLVELGLQIKGSAKQSNGDQKARAKEMAGNAIDQLADAAATPDDQASRKRRLVKGPEEFREARVDRSMRKD